MDRGPLTNAQLGSFVVWRGTLSQLSCRGAVALQWGVAQLGGKCQDVKGSRTFNCNKMISVIHFTCQRFNVEADQLDDINIVPLVFRVTECSETCAAGSVTRICFVCFFVFFYNCSFHASDATILWLTEHMFHHSFDLRTTESSCFGLGPTSGSHLDRRPLADWRN